MLLQMDTPVHATDVTVQLFSGMDCVTGIDCINGAKRMSIIYCMNCTDYRRGMGGVYSSIAGMWRIDGVLRLQGI